MKTYCDSCYRKGQCSMFGANATATPEGHLLQLRALDWDVDGIIIIRANNNNNTSLESEWLIN